MGFSFETLRTKILELQQVSEKGNSSAQKHDFNQKIKVFNQSEL